MSRSRRKFNQSFKADALDLVITCADQASRSASSMSSAMVTSSKLVRAERLNVTRVSFCRRTRTVSIPLGGWCSISIASTTARKLPNEHSRVNVVGGNYGNCSRTSTLQTRIDIRCHRGRELTVRAPSEVRHVRHASALPPVSGPQASCS